MVKCMNACKNYQKMIKDYDEGRLSLKQEEKFINHIIHCNDCNNDVTYNSFVDDFNIKCVHCGSIQLEVWDEKHCPKCGEKMVWGGDWGRNILEAFWD